MFFTNTSKGRSLLAAFASVLLVFSISGCGLFGGNPPSAPSDLQLSASQSGVQVSWSASAEATGYNIYRSEDSISTDLSNVSPVNGGTPVQDSTAFLDDTAENTTVYFYRVTAVNDAGESKPSSGANVRTPFPESPDRPSN